MIEPSKEEVDAWVIAHRYTELGELVELMECPACHGTGKENDGDAWETSPCYRCGGTGTVDDDEDETTFVSVEERLAPWVLGGGTLSEVKLDEE